MTRDEPPFVTGLLGRGSDRIGQVLRGAILSIGRGRALALSGLAILAVFILFLVRGIAQSPGIDGVVSGVVAGVIAALMCGAAAAWTLIWAFSADVPVRVDQLRAKALEDTLAPTLRELCAVRADVIRKGKERSLVRVPLGVASACLAWGLLQWLSDPPGVLALVVFGFVGGLAGEGWAIQPLNREYARLYKDRVLPQLVARFGDLTYRRASTDRIDALHEYRILTSFELSIAEDEIVGTYRGVPISVVEVRLESGSGDETRVVFDGLLIELILPRDLTGTTAIVADEGVLGNLTARLRPGALPHVRLEHPLFEKRYQVYATDQTEARTLLTPRFEERFMALGLQSRFSLPGALAQGNRFVVAVPKRNSVDLFEPPNYWMRSGGETLVAFTNDIKAVLEMADSVIEIEHWASDADTGARH